MADVIGVLIWAACAQWSIRIGLRKHRVLLGVWLGVCLAWLGVLIMLTVPARKEEGE